MSRVTLLLWILLLAAWPAFGTASDALQCVRVVAEDWGATHATLQRFERPSCDGAWRAVGAPMPALLGRHGLAWGVGLRPAPPTGPRKREGDGRSPAGLFRLSRTFGDAAAADFLDNPRGLPFIRIRAATEAVDDPASPAYNRIVERPAAGASWRSAERMDIPEYRVGVVVDHNAAARPGLGSCIFIHIQSGVDVPTSGCTALRLDDMRTLAGWLRRDARPVLAQMPRAAFASLSGAWGLP